MNILEKLRLIREGSLILEAPEDKYSISGEDEENTDETTEPTTSETVDDDQPATTDDQTSDEEPSTSDEGGDNEDDASGEEGSNNYELDDTGGDNTEGETNTDETPPTGQTNNAPKPGEMLNLDVNTRKILAHKNINRYRSLRDSVSNLISELTETPTSDDYTRNIILTCISKASELLDKLNAYIIHRYKENSYEVNYKNYAEFVLEKRIIEEILLELDKITDKK